MQPSRFKLAPLYVAVTFISSGIVSNLHAQEVSEQQRPATAEKQSEAVEKIAVLGSRRAARTETSTPAPVDFISSDDLSRQGNTDMSTMLRSVVPSFNVAEQPNLDEASFIRPANLRNLPPDHTLVLVNGKRRHRGAVITFLGSGVSDGAQGPDISPIPSVALKEVQVLRDGAAAQYGSDAIAGVMNFQLKDAADGFQLTARRGATFEGDGENYRIATNFGLPLTDNGFINISADYSEYEPTERQVQRSDAAQLSVNNSAIANPAQTWGSAEIKNDLKLFVNAGIDLNDSAQLYSFANYADKEVQTVFYYRTPDGSDRTQRFSNDGGETVLVGDTNLDNDITCPTIFIENGNPTTSENFDLISNGGELDSECFALAEIYPGGFAPIFGADVTDKSFAVGIKGEFDSGLYYDVSTHVGSSRADYFFINSVNPSWSSSTPNSVISPGYNVQTDTNVNIDLSYPVDVGLASDLNIAGGFEWRNEEYEVGLGDVESREAGDLAGQGFRETVDGFAGFSERAAGIFDRSNVAAYIDLEADVTDTLILGGALRYEDFDDFGSTTNFKLSSHLTLTDEISMRGTVSTGFRAPTPGQANSVRSSTSVTAAGIFESGIFAPTDPLVIALADAIPDAPQPQTLTPETSTNYSLGFIYSAGGIDLTIDFFRIEIEDRITLSSTVSITDTLDAGGAVAADLQAAIDALVAAGDSSASSISGFNFFINDFETTTTGVDVVLSMPIALNDGDTRLLAAYNHTDTQVEGSSDYLSDVRVFSIENGLPKDRLTLTAMHEQGNWSFVTRGSYYGEIGVGNDIGLGTYNDFDGYYSGKFLVDVEAQYYFNNAFSMTFGVQNLFNTYPDEVSNPADNAGQIYPEESPFGFNGGSAYLQLNYSI
ncbi:TonB-dependent receptor [Alteromonas sp. 1_MG-2023]|uniref:TonB-dependent receptor plug domain-containing protein n=1 Tax=Alteromonas sp. 1_MG-2023 TaxID=3062669 RepID=UPI0026E1266F|nr:TonB-dependent receptor [Alteromonas sp. 1_MG-2023]MDO6566664.1 TonB-dependent receptor [Alteromonas sp. 1_MG-2023]